MWGGSYGGYDQWATAKEFPPHLKTIAPAAAAFAGVDHPNLKNIGFPYVIQWLTLVSGKTPNFTLFDDQALWIGKFTERYLAHRPFRELDKIAGNTTTVWQTWVDHPARDSYWDACNPTDEQFARIDLPILTITGHYDGDQFGAMEYYRRHMRHASPEAKAKHHLLIGPWNHAGTRTPKTEFDGLKVGEASKLDLNTLHKAWYDWTMKAGKRPEFLKQRVAYYVTGAEVWKYADSLEAITTNTLKWHLDSVGGQANDAFHSGLLTEASPALSPSDRYAYDPLDVRPAALEQSEITNAITDQRYALNLFGNGLVYHSPAFTEATELTGYAKFTAWIGMDVPDTDFCVSLYEILSDGTSVLLAQDLMRARYRESLQEEKLIKPGEINRYVFDGFNFFSRLLAPGSRLRLVLRCPNSIYLEKNYNSGGVVSDETAKDARTAHVTLYHNDTHPSLLELPVVKCAPTQPVH
jgi:putative CocE/NonD family hydrolase